MCPAFDEEVCRDELVTRLASKDLLVRAPQLWRFHEDFAQQLALPAACSQVSSADAGFSLKWRRALVPARRPDFSGPRPGQHHDSVATQGNTIAVTAGGTLWIIDAESGVPRNIFVGANGLLMSRSLEEQFNPGFDVAHPVVAFAGDGGLLWVASAATPMLVDLGAIDRLKGPLVTVSVEAELLRSPIRPRPFEDWAPAKAAVGSDGTLFWRSASGLVRALELSGRVRWAAASAAGSPILDEDRVYWSSLPVGLQQSDGGTVWTPSTLPGWVFGEITDSRTGPLGSVIPVLWSSSRTLSAHRRDGSLSWAVDAGISDSAYFATTEDSSGTLYASRRIAIGGQPPVGVVEARNSFASGAYRWAFTPTELDGGAIFPGEPVASRRNAGVYFTGSDCQLYALDGNGTVRGAFPLNGVPMGITPHLVGDTLYVVTAVPMAPTLGRGQRTFPDSTSFDIMERYGCPSPSSELCVPIEGDAESVLFLSAVRVE